MRSTEIGFEAWWTRHFLAPQFDALGAGALIRRPWHVEVFGPGIAAGRDLHLMAERAAPVRLSTWARPDRPPPRIRLGDHVLIMPGVMLNAALAIDIGDDCMLASHVMISDSDWHDHYDRTKEPETNAPITLARNVWIGLRTIVCKGVAIGENAIIGAGSVVTHNVPENAIAAGNPARIVGTLDVAHAMKTRAALFTDTASLQAWMQATARAAAKGNTTLGALRAALMPQRED
jgi:acetyltransferase-like isoleucine patch superfamily enzyme